MNMPESVLRGRFIPACAGNTISQCVVYLWQTVHPRVRGEHFGWTPETGRADGSSPRARGTPESGEISEAGRRFIPACAGNTRYVPTNASSSPVHPRVRGEHPSDCSSILLMTGSSPRARGTPPFQSCRAYRPRFIPACAGNTIESSSATTSPSVHPRVRGEHSASASASAGTSGSSPRARGTRTGDCPLRLRLRFIPACAGNTPMHGTVLLSSPVHPRVRGEHSIVYRCEMMQTGSSPRARGTPHAGGPALPVQRFIPACAGNTCAS